MSFKFWGLILLILIISSCKKELSVPTVKTSSIQIDKNNNYINVTGNVTSEGASAVSKRGFCWSTVTNPTVSDATSSNSYGPGQFSQEITGLALNSTYFIKSYATNANGTSYGNQLEIKTLSAGKFGLVSFDSLYKNKQKISDFPRIYYWSSTEVDCEEAWVQNVYEGGLIKQDKKSGANTVRVIRAF